MRHRNAEPVTLRRQGHTVRIWPGPVVRFQVDRRHPVVAADFRSAVAAAMGVLGITEPRHRPPSA